MTFETNPKDGAAIRGMTHVDVVLPSQHFAPPRKQAPEQRLMIAVLHSAIDCIEKHRFATNKREQQLFSETQQWFLADEPAWPYSFESICGALDLDSDAVRHSLRLHLQLRSECQG